MTEGRERYWRQVEELRTRLGLSHSEARGQWSRYYEKGGKPKRAIKKIVLSVQASRTDAKTCPFCRDSIFHPEEGGGPDFVCDKCQAHYHLDCFEDELGGSCATLGCATRRVINQARVRIRARGPVVTTATTTTRDTSDRDLSAAGRRDLVRRLEEQRRAQQEEDRHSALKELQRHQAARDRRQRTRPERKPVARESSWERFVKSIVSEGPILAGLAALLLLVGLLCWLYVFSVAG